MNTRGTEDDKPSRFIGIMTDLAEEHYEDMTRWEREFVITMLDRADQYGAEFLINISDRQYEIGWELARRYLDQSS